MRNWGRMLRFLAVSTVLSLAMVGSVKAVECNSNCSPAECDVTGSDCNANGLYDGFDISMGTSEDCNGNLIPDECELPECEPIDVVFLLDTSGSMEADLARICLAIDNALAQLTQAGLCVRSEKLEIRDTPAGTFGDCPCCEVGTDVFEGV